ncbi:CMGC family protein kinase [Histomonas meleagridis]|uniref:CMGC family protein kinase n=1 Tax=Histomonas meleagridis TaxID=135588 RepID=UPI003559897A|nr:CMGC family protein kinase [Histomonas meleagridis]KAH0796383.1 CMGC family protein kinase [Histomonas meleagridis]
MDNSKRYVKGQKLGSGSYGRIHLGTDTQTGEIVAMKYIKFDHEENGISSYSLREASILQSVNHPNIIAFRDIVLKENELVIITEYFGFNLRYYISRLRKQHEGFGGENHMKRDLIRSYSFQLLCGIFELHSHRIIHRDIKPENILINKDGLLKICDFGLSRYYTIPLRTYSPGVISTWYRPNELLECNQPYDTSIDIWSVGCVIAEMSTLKPLFESDSPAEMIHKMVGVKGTPNDDELTFFPSFYKPTEKVPPTEPRIAYNSDDFYFLDLVGKMLQYNPAKRISIVDALRHPYFDNIPAKLREMCWPKDLPCK